MVWIWTVLLALCLTNNAVARKIITSPDWPDPFVAGELIVKFTEEAIEPIAQALERGVKEGRFLTVPSRGNVGRKFVLSEDTRPWVTGIGAIDSLNRMYGLKAISSFYYRDDPYGRKSRILVLEFSMVTEEQGRKFLSEEVFPIK